MKQRHKTHPSSLSVSIRLGFNRWKGMALASLHHKCALQGKSEYTMPFVHIITYKLKEIRFMSILKPIGGYPLGCVE